MILRSNLDKAAVGTAFVEDYCRLTIVWGLKISSIRSTCFGYGESPAEVGGVEGLASLEVRDRNLDPGDGPNLRRRQ